MIDSQEIQNFWRLKIEKFPQIRNSIILQTLVMTDFVIKNFRNGITQFDLYQEVAKCFRIIGGSRTNAFGDTRSITESFNFLLSRGAIKHKVINQFNVFYPVK
ncbi:hypothetical protein [Acetobacter persici]|uniref:hypothetical protein n=1 Tax=Acetobacter persici TaxID=1076596 RepID=UPI001BACC2DD|nr:hypothetical protein [Acetobacter persici]MBS1017262.1 hypothetical protein [Acetobacter persici]